MIALILLYLSEVTSQEVTTPASLLGPRNFNYHPYNLNQFIQNVEPTKKGPVLFPNDAPPPPRPPLIVTSRPILESIARSELNPLPPNNSISESEYSSQNSPNLNSFSNTETFDSNLGVSSNPVQNFVDVDFTGSNPESQASSYNLVPYANLLRRGELNEYLQDNRYDFQQQTLPPIYKALSDNARHNLIQLKKKPARYNTQDDDYQYDNDVSGGNRNTEYDENNNYAFSYRVNDHKTGDDFSHSQQSSGSGTNGEYRVRLPDGRVQIVSYTADENGYKANVRYEEAAVKENHGLNNQKNQKQVNYVPKVNNNYNRKNDLQNEYENNDYIDYKTKDYNTNINVPTNEYNSNNYNSNNYNSNNYNSNDYNNNDYNSNDYNDFSNEYSQNYDPYKSKFSVYNPIYSSTAKPIIENDISDSVRYESSTEAVVLIGNRNLYTNVNNIKPSFVTPSVSFVTPSTYLASTIASLRDRITAKPVLTKSFIDKINKYLTFK